MLRIDKNTFHHCLRMTDMKWLMIVMTVIIEIGPEIIVIIEGEIDQGIQLFNYSFFKPFKLNFSFEL